MVNDKIYFALLKKKTRTELEPALEAEVELEPKLGHKPVPGLEPELELN